jgi:hypothetical protein
MLGLPRIIITINAPFTADDRTSPRITAVPRMSKILSAELIAPSPSMAPSHLEQQITDPNES